MHFGALPYKNRNDRDRSISSSFCGLHHTAYFNDLTKNRQRARSISPTIPKCGHVTRLRCLYNPRSSIRSPSEIDSKNPVKFFNFAENEQPSIELKKSEKMIALEKKSPEEFKKIIADTLTINSYLDKIDVNECNKSIPSTESALSQTVPSNGSVHNLQDFLKNFSEANASNKYFKTVKIEENALKLENIAEKPSVELLKPSPKSTRSSTSFRRSLDGAGTQRLKSGDQLKNPQFESPSIIESIRSRVFDFGDFKRDDSDDEEWTNDKQRTVCKFPKETRNALTPLMHRNPSGKRSNQCEICKMNRRKIVHTAETQTSPRLSSTNVNINIFQGCDDELPCARNLLCSNGSHCGRCTSNVNFENYPRRKYIGEDQLSQCTTLSSNVDLANHLIPDREENCIIRKYHEFQSKSIKGNNGKTGGRNH